MNSEFVKNKRMLVLNVFVSMLLIAVVVPFFPMEFLLSCAKADNPEGCRYYITLQSILVNYPTFSSDPANARMIKTRLMEYERDLGRADLDSSVISEYRTEYNKALASLNVSSVSNVSDNTAVAIAMSAYNSIDNFYLDKRLFCVNPLYKWTNTGARRILLFNLGGLFDKLQNRYSRIQFVAPSGLHLGIFPGFLVNNQSTTLETQFMTGMPMITALYVIPGYDYANVGSYNSLVPWCAFSSNYITDKGLRKIMNISGIDVFAVSTKEVSARKAKKEMTSLPNVVPLKTGVSKQFIEDVQPYVNTQSYGMAYLANAIHYENPADIKKYEDVLKQYFAYPRHNPAVFHAARDVLYGKLWALNKKHDVIIESPRYSDALPDFKTSAGNAAIQGMVGGRILSTAECDRKECMFILNVAKAPGWHAYVNGVASEIDRANFAFMSTAVPEGKSTVWFIYESMSQLVSFIISLGMLMMVLLYTLSVMPAKAGNQE